MKNFECIRTDLDVAPLLNAIDDVPDVGGTAYVAGTSVGAPTAMAASPRIYFSVVYSI